MEFCAHLIRVQVADLQLERVVWMVVRVSLRLLMRVLGYFWVLVLFAHLLFVVLYLRVHVVCLMVIALLLSLTGAPGHFLVLVAIALLIYVGCLAHVVSMMDHVTKKTKKRATLMVETIREMVPLVRTSTVI
jgi:hypothetical protein